MVPSCGKRATGTYIIECRQGWGGCWGGCRERRGEAFRDWGWRKSFSGVLRRDTPELQRNEEVGRRTNGTLRSAVGVPGCGPHWLSQERHQAVLWPHSALSLSPVNPHSVRVTSGMGLSLL